MTLQQSNYIKVVAIITMFVDHIGAILLPDVVILRIIGRISFPLFAYQICIGYENTKNIKKYLVRLLFFGSCIQLFFGIAASMYNIKFDIHNLNIFFTLALGIIAIICYDKKKYFILFLIAVVPSLLNYYNLQFAYGLYGVVLILLFHIAKKYSFLYKLLILLLLNFFYCFDGSVVQMFSLLSLMVLFKPLSLKFNIPKQLFYIFYPVHLAVLYAISIIL